MPQLAAWQWAIGMFCAFSIGVSKTGMPGFGMLSIPFMVFTVGDARLSAGWLLPLLCMADLFAVAYWRRHSAASRLFALAPWVLVGIGLGALALAWPERVLRPMVGAIILTMLGVNLWRRYASSVELTPHPFFYGLAAGFSTTVANAAGPAMNLYLLSKRLPKEEFLATGAWFFFIVNLSKLPIYMWHKLISVDSLTFDATMAPALAVGAVTGRWLVTRIPQRIFELTVIVLTAAAALPLLL